jgi:Scavenger receptor cysteine-rich domain/Low-density lipoprotein receptor domain class A
MADADVLCRELGFAMGAQEVRLNSFYAANPNLNNEAGTPLFAMDEIECVGNETSLKDCKFKGWGVHDCNAEELVGVVCKLPVMTCPLDYWLCKTSQECIPTGFLCDNVPDCEDGSDEHAGQCNVSLTVCRGNPDFQAFPCICRLPLSSDSPAAGIGWRAAWRSSTTGSGAPFATTISVKRRQQ